MTAEPREVPVSKIFMLNRSDDYTFKLYYWNGVFAGNVMKDEDGYYKWWPDMKPGFLEAYQLQEIGRMLDELNEEWHKEVMEACL